MIKIILKYSVLGALLLVSGIFIYLFTLDINQYKPAIIKVASELTGRELRIDGELELIPSLTPTISVHGVTLANAPWSDSGASMLSIGRIEARAALLPLLSQRVRIQQFILHDAKLSLETDAEGRGNWVLDSAPASGPERAVSTGNSPTELPSIRIDQIDIRNADIVYTDGRTTKSSRFNIRELTTGVNDTESPLSFTLNAAYDEYPIQLDGKLGSVDTLLTNNAYPVDINGRIADVINLQATGTIARPLDAEGIDVNFSASIETLADLNRFAESDLPRISPVSLSGKLIWSEPDTINIDALAMQIGTTGMTGRMGYHRTGNLPLLSLQLQSDLIDLQPFVDTSVQQPKPEYLFARNPLPLAMLSTLNMDATLTAKQFKSKPATLENLQVAIKSQNGEVRATLASSVAGGRMDGALTLDSTTQRPSSSLELTARGVRLDQLPHDGAKPWFSGGPTELQVSGTGHGTSVAEIAGNFSGKVVVQVGEATLPDSNINLFGADVLMSVFNKLNPFASREKTTLLECAVINLQIQDGIAKVDRQIAMQTSRMSLAGSGEINFKTEQLNLGIKPYAREGVGVNLGSLTSFAKIGGTLANPRADVDSQGAMKAGITAGAAVATGGLSLLAQGLYDKKTRDPAPCATALGKSVAPAQTQKPADGIATEEKKEGLLNNVKSGFKKLFGN